MILTDLSAHDKMTIITKRRMNMYCTSITSYNECLTPAVWSYPNITRPFSIIYYALGGSAFYTIDGIERPFEKEHLYVLPANKVFSLREDPNDKFYSVYIHAFTSPEIGTVLDIDTKTDIFITEILKLIRKYAKVKDGVYLRHLTDMLLSYIFESLTETDSTLTVKIKSYIDENFIKTFNCNDLSSEFNYSNSYLSKLFREKYDLTPKQYVKQLILKEAVLLLSKGRSVCETSEKLGFSSPENFSRFFKGYYGYSPSQYIKRFKNFPI